MKKISLCAALACMSALVSSTAAWATPQPLPFSYTVETLGQGDLEIEQYIDVTPTNATSQTSGKSTPYLGMQFQTEFEYGVLDKLELAIYVTLTPSTEQFENGAVMMEGNGSKQRLRYRFADTGVWPIDVGLYGEVTENTREIELELKVLLQRRILRGLKAVVNLWAEREYYYAGNQEWGINPTAGLTYEISPRFQPGIEYWMHQEFPDNALPAGTSSANVSANHYLGATMLFNFGKLWWSSGVYLRLNNFLQSPAAIASSPAMAYGDIWVRTVVGLSL